MRRTAAAALVGAGGVGVARNHGGGAVWTARPGSLPSPAAQLRERLGRAVEENQILLAPCCSDALSAKLIEQSGHFALMFMSGFGVAAVRGMPDTGLITYTEMQQTVAEICQVVKSVSVIADGDTGYGNAINVKRTVCGYAQVGAACVMIEDQVAPKRCGYTAGKTVVDRQEAFSRVQAAVDARSQGADILIMARTDAAGVHGVDEAIERCKEFRRLGADITHVSGLKDVEDMQRYCKEVSGPKMYNNLSAGCPLSVSCLRDIGFTIVIFPDTLLGASVKAMSSALDHLADANTSGKPPQHAMVDFKTLKTVVGFDAYDKEQKGY